MAFQFSRSLFDSLRFFLIVINLNLHKARDLLKTKQLTWLIDGEIRLTNGLVLLLAATSRIGIVEIVKSVVIKHARWIAVIKAIFLQINFTNLFTSSGFPALLMLLFELTVIILSFFHAVNLLPDTYFDWRTFAKNRLLHNVEWWLGQIYLLFCRLLD